MDARNCCTHREVKLVDFDQRFSFSCHACNQMGYGMCYQCKNGCDYKLHEECLRASPEAYYSFFGKHPFSLQYRPLGNYTGDLCTACGMGVNGLMYVCTIDCRSTVFLHPCCMTLPPSIVANGERFTLKKQLVCLECQYCERTTLTGRVDGWAYVSADQESACHVQCMKNKLYEDWIKHAFPEETQGELILTQEPWWESLDYDSSSNSSSPASPVRGSSQGQQQQQQQQQHNSLALVKNPSTGRKRRILRKFTKVAVKIFIHTATGDPFSLIMCLPDLLNVIQEIGL